MPTVRAKSLSRGGRHVFAFQRASIIARWDSTQSDFLTENNSAPSTTFNLKGFKSEVDRGVYRTHKKLTKANERLAKLKAGTVENKEQEDEVQLLIIGLEDNLLTLREIDSKLKDVKAKDDASLPSLLEHASKLGISDAPKPLPPRGPKKAKGKPVAARLPYFTYMSRDDIVIRVGLTSKDNDEVSCNPEHRDNADWWLHVSGCPGSHVIIRSHDDALQSTAQETVVDAAVLAVVNSKAANAKGHVKVNLTRARNVSKPIGAKPGLVRLSGDIYTVSVDVKAEAKRLERLLETKK